MNFKKALKLVLSVLIVYFLVGCEIFDEVSEEEKEAIFNAMKEQNIISDDYKKIDVERSRSWILEVNARTIIFMKTQILTLFLSNIKMYSVLIMII